MTERNVTDRVLHDFWSEDEQWYLKVDELTMEVFVSATVLGERLDWKPDRVARFAMKDDWFDGEAWVDEYVAVALCYDKGTESFVKLVLELGDAAATARAKIIGQILRRSNEAIKNSGEQLVELMDRLRRTERDIKVSQGLLPRPLDN